MAVSITTNEQDVYPPRVLVTVTGLTLGDDVSVYRQVTGVRTILRAGSAQDVTDTAFLVVDAELPYDLPVTYVAVVNGSSEYTTGATTYALPGGKVALSDAITGLSAEVTILAWPSRLRSRQSTTFAVGGRNVVVSSPLAPFTGQMQVYVETWSSAENVLTLLEQATEGIIQVRRPLAAYEGVDCYVYVDSVDEQRFSQDGSDPRRTLALDVVAVESWASEAMATGFTYADLDALYDGLTYADLASDFATYLDLEQADLSS